ncbi:glycoside hydrolase family 20 zincin-like fold domain-containing protein [Mucilaginibacter sp.]|uniref:glycoside hydrolase family 20 zincin-like fold domain-containing protein n=1 Tax=Mucilaginibacter sp. TaxID=1882438 RepID=UPI002630411C|nr:glycoside hydrolase family 20 zincin-like fold domain-containing protein [Mucilaginibacter sp.]MDB4925002.1 hypothetical protein [Mucilaginibacter sp.]
MNRLIKICLVLFIASTLMSAGTLQKVAVVYDKTIPQLQFGVQEFESAFKMANLQYSASPAGAIVVTFVLDKSLGAEAYKITQINKTIKVRGGDSRGLMYAGLDLADKLQAGKDLLKTGTVEGKPYMPYRGIKFNIPLDARSPSYDDTGDAAQMNIETMWDFDYWKNYLDNMARDRYNLLTLWNLHPYPSMVKVPGYEDVALNDVCVYTGAINSKTDMRWKKEPIQDPQHLRVVKKITIDEKIAFWKKVFKYADDRGIDIHMYHWNVFVNGAEGKHGIEARQDSPEAIEYLRKSVKQFMLTYPTVKGIGVTAGENTKNSIKGEYSVENFIWQTYGKGVMEAKAINPKINCTFIFRQHESDMNLISTAFKDYVGPFDTEFKYARARMFSSEKPTWFDKIYKDEVVDHKIKVWMNVRNDDIFTFRWGKPEYANDFIKNMPKSLMAGYFWGPDGYIYGRDFHSKDEGVPKYEIDKQWYLFMIWGMAGYNPDLPESYYIDKIAEHFPGTNAKLMYTTWNATADVIEWVDKIHYRQNDAEFLAEGSFDITKFKDLNAFARNDCMPDQGVTAIGDFAQKGKVAGELTPIEVADKLTETSKILLAGAAKLKDNNNPELKQTIGDFKAMGYLADYYAHKVKGATYTALYRFAGDEKNKAQAVAETGAEVAAWINYANAASAQYKPQLFARTQNLDWNALTDLVKQDVNIAKSAQKGEPVAVAASNKLWEKDKKKL